MSPYTSISDRRPQVLAGNGAPGPASRWAVIVLLAGGLFAGSAQSGAAQSPQKPSPAGQAVSAFLTKNPKLQVLALATDQELVAVAGDSAAAEERFVITIWDMDTKKPVRFLKGHTGAVTGLALDKKRLRLVSAGEDQTLRLWDLVAAKELHQFPGHRGPVTGVAINEDLTTMVTGCADNVVRVWDLRTNEESGRLEDHTTGHLKVAMLRHLALSGSAHQRGKDYALRYWNTSSGKLIRRLEGHTAPITSLALLRDGRRALSGSQDGTARLWDLESGQEIGRYVGKKGPVTAVNFAGDGMLGVTVSDGVAHIWELSSRRLVQALPTNFAVTGAGFVQRRNLVITAGGNVLQLWDIASVLPSVTGLESKIVSRVIRMPGKDRPILGLQRSLEPSDPPTGSGLPILGRELFRQALLLAAREELGLDTRDGLLGETIETAAGTPAAAEFSVTWAAGSRYAFDVIQRKSELDAKTLWSETNPWAPDARFGAFVAKAEAISRTGLPEALRQAGFVAAPLPKPSQARIAAETEKRLAELTIPSQFAALRDLHAAMRRQGESPELVGGLVRGYANMGLLTETHWSPAHKAFKARAFLYAQRLTARDPKSAWGPWHKAYAAALAGMHGDAIILLNSARKAGDQSSAPAWVQAVYSLCRFQSDKLASLAQGNQAQFAGLLRFVTLEQVVSPAELIRAGEEYLKINPESYRVLDSMSAVGGVGYGHVGSDRALALYDQTFAKRLGELPQFPAAAGPLVFKTLDDPVQGEPALRRALRQAPASGEPSWGMLADLAHQARFLATWRRFEFFGYLLASPVEPEFIEQSEQLVGDHPFFPFLLMATGQPTKRERYEQVNKMIAEMRWSEVDCSTQIRFIGAVQKYQPTRSGTFNRIAIQHHDPLYRDLLAVLAAVPKANSNDLQKLLGASPYSPAARARLIRQGWDFAQKFAAKWEKEGHPLVLTALGEHYLQNKDLDGAQRVLEASLQRGARREAYLELAKLYDAKKDPAKWLATLEESLKLEDTGLAHARTRTDIAQHFMKQKDYQKALPYAEAAAQTGAAWAMLCAHECQDALGNFDKAEEYVAATSQRYAENSFDWYWWCKRSGHGKEEQAREVVDDFLKAIGDKGTVTTTLNAAMYYVLSGQDAKAETAFATVAKITSDDRVQMYLVLIADKRGNKDLRDATLGTFQNRQGPFAQFARQIRQALAQNQGKLDSAAMDKLLANQPAATKMDLGLMAGMYLLNHGHPQEAIRYFDSATESPATPVRAMAATLRRQAAGK